MWVHCFPQTLVMSGSKYSWSWMGVTRVHERGNVASSITVTSLTRSMAPDSDKFNHRIAYHCMEIVPPFFKKVKVYCQISCLKTYQRTVHLPPGHWFVFKLHFNSTQSMQSCSHCGALNLSYKHCRLCPIRHVSLTPESSEACESNVPCRKDTTSKQCPNIERGYFFENPAPSGVWTTRQEAT